MKRPVLVVLGSALGGALLTLAVIVTLAVHSRTAAPAMLAASARTLAGASPVAAEAAMPAPALQEEPADRAERFANRRAMAPSRSVPKELAKRKGDGARVDDDFEKVFGAGPGGGDLMEARKGRKDDRASGGKEAGGKAEGEQEATPSRAWFPETFLFAPEVVTDAEGRATVSTRVPDRLTSWRVLALAHSREGAQAGAVSSFRGTLPSYVDLVVPSFLMAGDEVRLPVQVVNTTDEAIAQPLRIEAVGAEVVGKAASLELGAHQSRVEYATLRAKRPGSVAVRALLGSADAVVRTIPVLPTGRAVEIRRSGTLAAPRRLAIEGPLDLDPDSARARLLVFPGALALLRSELAVALGRTGVAEDAYALQLAGRASGLLKALGEEADPEALRRIRLVAGQRVLRHGRAAQVEVAALVAEAALAHPGDPLLSRLGARAAELVAAAQRPDGTFSGGSGWTLQRLLVTTAEGLRVVQAAAPLDAGARQRAASAAVRANGAFERNLERIQDPYTAAAILTSGGVSGAMAEKLRALVREAVKVAPDGSRSIAVPAGAVRPDGIAPTAIELTALAVLALQDDLQAPWRVDLAGTLLGTYSPGPGWGDGRTNQAALRAVLATFRDPLPQSIHIVLALDGKPVAEGTFEAAKAREVMSLEALAPAARGAHTWTVGAEPAIPGLGYSLSLQTYVPWSTAAQERGLELKVGVPASAKVGEPLTVTLDAVAPAGLALQIRQALPAGVQPDRGTLDALVRRGALRGYRAEDGAVALDVAPLGPGQSFHASYRVVATLAGTLRSGPSTLAPAERPELAEAVGPATWTIK